MPTTPKQELRRELRARLDGMTSVMRAGATEELVRRVRADAGWQAARTVALFAPLPQEPDITGLAVAAWAEGKRVVFPRMEGTGLVLHATEDGQAWNTGLFGVREPHGDAPRVGLAEIDWMAVPGLGFDRAGGRLGRGAGFYDRLLAGAEPGLIRAGLCFSAQEIAQVPMDFWDVRLTRIFTEKETIPVGE